MNTKGRNKHKGVGKEVAKKANDNRNKNPRNEGNKHGKGKRFGALGGYRGVNKKQARRLVNDSVRPELNKLRRDKSRTRSDAADALRDVEDLYTRSVGDINHVFGAADQKVSSLAALIGQGYQNAASAVGQQDQQAASKMASGNAAATAAVAAELQRLGIGASMGQGMAQDSAFAQQMQAQTAANNQSGIAMQQASANTLSQMLGGMIAGSKASNLGQATNARTQGINDVNDAKQDQLTSITDAIAQLRSSKPAMFRDMLMQMQAQGFDQWQAMQALNMDRRQMNHNMAMDRAGMAQDAAYYSTGASMYGKATGPGGVGSTDWTKTSPSGGRNPKMPNGKPMNPTVRDVVRSYLGNRDRRNGPSF